MFSHDEQLHQEVIEHLSKIKTLVIATRDAQAPDPDASYAPYVEVDGNFYVLISMLAAHTRNILSYPRCHILFIADEQNSPNLFARKRVSFRCDSRTVERSESLATAVISKMRDRFGPAIEMISGLSDFHLIELSPEAGLFVKGFGQAIPLNLNKG